MQRPDRNSHAPRRRFTWGAQLTKSLICLWLAVVPLTGGAQESVLDWSVTALLADAGGFDTAKLGDAIRQQMAAEETPPVNVKITTDGVEFELGKGSARVSLQRAPVSQVDTLMACKIANWHWRQACDVSATHQAHVRVELRDTRLRKVDSAMIATRLLAAVADVSKTVATLWGVNLQSVDEFRRSTANLQRERVPVALWIAYRFTREASGNVSVLTRGMPAFELMEMESRDTPFPGRDLLEMVMNTSQRLIMKGAVIGDGETIGGPPGRRVFVRFGDSHWTPGHKVYRVEVGS